MYVCVCVCVCVYWRGRAACGFMGRRNYVFYVYVCMDMCWVGEARGREVFLYNNSFVYVYVCDEGWGRRDIDRYRERER